MFPDLLEAVTLEPDHEELGLVVRHDCEFELVEVSYHLALVVRSAGSESSPTRQSRS